MWRWAEMGWRSGRAMVCGAKGPPKEQENTVSITQAPQRNQNLFLTASLHKVQLQHFTHKTLFKP